MIKAGVPMMRMRGLRAARVARRIEAAAPRSTARFVPAAKAAAAALPSPQSQRNNQTRQSTTKASSYFTRDKKGATPGPTKTTGGPAIGRKERLSLARI